MVTFLIIPKNWDNNEDNITKIMAQVTSEDTVERAINNFFIKLQKPPEAISVFKFNDIPIDVKSQQKLKDFGVESNSKIYAFQSDTFNTVNNMNNNNNNNAN